MLSHLTIAMALELGTISTGVDGFIRLVRESGRIDITDAAVRLGMSRQVLEEWAQVLEEQGLIRIEYQLTKVYLIWVAATKEEVEAKREAITDKRSATLRQAESQLEEILKIGQQLDEMEDEFTQISEAFEVRMGGIKSRIDALQDIKRQREELRYGIEALQGDYAAKLKTIKDQVFTRDKEISEALRKEEALISKTKQMELRLAEFRTTRDELSSLLGEAKVELGPGLERITKQASSVIKAVDESEMEHLDLARKAKATAVMVKRSKESISALSREIAARSADLDEVARKQEALESRTKELGARLAELRTSRDVAMAAVDKARRELAPGMAQVMRQVEAVSKEFAARDAEYADLAKRMRASSMALKKGRETLTGLEGELEARSLELGMSLKRQEMLTATLKELEPRVGQFHDEGDELRKGMEKARRGLAELAKVSKRAESIAKDVDASEREFGDLARRAHGMERALKKNREYLADFSKEISVRVVELEKMRSTSTADLERISLEIEKEYAQASGYVGNFEQRIEKMRGLDARLRKLSEERKSLVDGMNLIIKDLQSVDFSRAMISTDEMLRRMASAKEKLAQMDERTKKYGERQKETKSALKTIWEVEGKGG